MIFNMIDAAILSGMEYETGTFQPPSNTANPTISFSRPHNAAPFCAMLAVQDPSYVPNESPFQFHILNFDGYYGAIPTIGTTREQAQIFVFYRNAVGGVSSMTWTVATNSTKGLSYYLTASEFKPYSGNDSYTFRSARKYDWVAIWKPDEVSA